MVGPRNTVATRRRAGEDRSEEHTSEFQSLTNLVCRLLLEKKNNNMGTFLTNHATIRVRGKGGGGGMGDYVGCGFGD